MGKKGLGSVLVLLGASSYGLLAPIIKSAYQAGYSEAEVISSQVVVAFALYGMLLTITGRWRQVWKGLSVRERALLFLLGAGGMGGTGIFYYLSLHRLPASLAIILLFQFTLVVFVWELLLKKRWPTPVQLLSIALILGGTYLAVGQAGPVFFPDSPAGWIFGLLSAVTYGTLLYFMGEIAPHHPSLGKSWYMLTGALILNVVVFPPVWIVNGRIMEGLLGWGLATGVLGMVLPTSLFAVGIPMIGGVLAGILGAVELPVSMLSSRIWLQEPVSGLQWLGMGLILAGIVLSHWKFPRTPVGTQS